MADLADCWCCEIAFFPEDLLIEWDLANDPDFDMRSFRALEEFLFG